MGASWWFIIVFILSLLNPPNDMRLLFSKFRTQQAPNIKLKRLIGLSMFMGQILSSTTVCCQKNKMNVAFERIVFFLLAPKQQLELLAYCRYENNSSKCRHYKFRISNVLSVCGSFILHMHHIKIAWIESSNIYKRESKWNKTKTNGKNCEAFAFYLFYLLSCACSKTYTRKPYVVGKR